jgi:hypothetical protein
MVSPLNFFVIVDEFTRPIKRDSYNSIEMFDILFLTESFN